MGWCKDWVLLYVVVVCGGGVFCGEGEMLSLACGASVVFSYSVSCGLLCHAVLGIHLAHESRRDINGTPVPWYRLLRFQ